MLRTARVVLICGVAIVPLTSPGTAHAQALLGVAGVVGGGYLLADKAGRDLRGSISAAQRAGHELIARGDAAAKDRLDQIDKIQSDFLKKAEEIWIRVAGDIKKFSQEIDRIIAATLKQIEEVGRTLFRELSEIVWQVECAGKRFTYEDLKNALGRFGSLIGTHEIRIYPPLLHDADLTFFGNPVSADFQIKNHFPDTYYDISKYLLDRLESDGRDETPVRSIRLTHEYLAALADRTLCFVPKEVVPHYYQLAREHGEIALLWADLVPPARGG